MKPDQAVYDEVDSSRPREIPSSNLGGGIELLVQKYVFILGLKGGLYGFPNIYVDKDILKVIHDTLIGKKE